MRRSYHPPRAQPLAWRGFTGGSTLAMRGSKKEQEHMTVMNIVRPAALVLLLATPAMAQSGRTGAGQGQTGTVTTADIQRLQDQVYDASNEISRLRSRDQALSDRLQSQLDDVRDEVVYLRVKMRKEGSVSRRDYNDVRAQIDSVRAEARGEASRQGTSSWGTGSGTGSGSPSGYGSGTGAGTGTSGGVYGGTADSPN